MHAHIFDYIRKHFILGVACENSYMKLIMDIIKALRVHFSILSKFELDSLSILKTLSFHKL